MLDKNKAILAYIIEPQTLLDRLVVLDILTAKDQHMMTIKALAEDVNSILLDFMLKTGSAEVYRIVIDALCYTNQPKVAEVLKTGGGNYMIKLR